MSFKEPVKYFCQCCDVYMGPTIGSNGINGRLHQDNMRYYCWNCWHGWDFTPYCSYCYGKQQEEQEAYEENQRYKDEQDKIERKYDDTHQPIGLDGAEQLSNNELEKIKKQEELEKIKKQEELEKINQRLVKLGLKSNEELYKKVE